jgi:hypothetical protein
MYAQHHGGQQNNYGFIGTKTMNFVLPSGIIVCIEFLCYKTRWFKIKNDTGKNRKPL